MLDRIGVGLEPAHQFLFATRPTGPEFERWLLEQLGGRIGAEVVADANAIAAGRRAPAAGPRGRESTARSLRRPRIWLTGRSTAM